MSLPRADVTPTCESLEPRRLFAAAKLALVHQELHRPPTALVDMNRDGLLDAVVGTTDVRVSGGRAAIVHGFNVLLSDGKGTMRFGGHTDCDDSDPNLASDFVIGDFNRDGELDVAMRLYSVTAQPTPTGITINEKFKLVVFSGDGRGGFKQGPTTELQHARGGSAGAPKQSFASKLGGIAKADVDGDGADDIISIANDNAVIVHAGGKEVSKVEVMFNPKEYTRCIAVGDVDGDGAADIVAIVDGTLTYAAIDFSSGKEPALGKVNKIESLTFKQSVNVQVGDLDGDGLGDDFLFGDGRDVILGINHLDTGRGMVFEKLSPRLRVNSADVLVGDLDGDGDDELFILATRRPPMQGHVTVLK
jgi:hypothetical protein